MNAEPETVYLQLIGRLGPDNRLRLRPGYLTSTPRQIGDDPESDLVAVLVDDNGKELLRYGVPLLSYCADGEMPAARAVRATIPFHPDTRTIRFIRGDVDVAEINVSRTPPKVRLEWEPPTEIAGKETITWEAEHPEGTPLEFFLRYSHTGGRTWQRASLRTRETNAILDFGAMPGGRRCKVAVVATDGVNTAIASSRAFAVPVKPCRALILAPPDGAEHHAGESIILEGQGYYLEERRPELESLVWTSDPPGLEGTGAFLEVPDIPPGSYRVTLEAGRGRRAGKETILISVWDDGPESAREATSH